MNVQSLIKNNFGDCGSGDTILLEIRYAIDVTSGKGYAVRLTPKSNLIEAGLLKSIEQARSLAERNKKDICEYLEMSLRRKWFYNYTIGYAR